MKKILSIILFISTVSFAQTNVQYSISGIEKGDSVVVSFGSNKYLSTIKIFTNGNYSFNNIASGRYFIKSESIGYNSYDAIEVNVGEGGNITPNTISLALSKSANKEDEFEHSWTQDASISGNTTTAYVNTKPKIEFQGRIVDASDEASADMLRYKYNIVLSNEGESWTQEYAYRILETMKDIPQVTRKSYQDKEGKISKWTLTEEHLFNDVEVIYNDNGNTVKISKDAFVYATPQIVNIDGVRGTFFSKRLHSSLVRYTTNFGEDTNAVEKILNERFACSTLVPNYTDLTSLTTHEDEHRFQKFSPTELIYIISMFEEMPRGFHVVKELKYLVRRKNGHIHPTHPTAPAVAWAGIGYIEFMESAFKSDIEHLFRLILHEKTHFLWAHVFSDEIKNDWIKVGGWYQNTDDPDGWSTTKQTEFVSAYAHKKNPNEDMAESVSYYIKNPDKLRSRSINKFEFIRDRIMHGTRYITMIPDHLTFEVLNLFPDYDYPGKIKRLDINVVGEAEDDKTITVEIELENIEGYQDAASGAYMRVASTQGTYFDLHLRPIDDGHILKGTYRLSKHAKAGNWDVDQIKVTDKVGNQRFEGVDDFIWRLYINNPLEDLIKPEYVSKTLEYSLVEKAKDEHKINELTVSFKVKENLRMRSNGPVMIRLANNIEELQSATDDIYGTFNEDTKIGTVVYNFTEYMPSGDYYVTMISLTDEAKNKNRAYFSNSPNDEPIQTITINSSNSDNEGPEIDLNRMSISAEPTHPDAPDGETKVEITYYARDDKSGLGTVSYRLLDPQGISHFEYHYHDNFYTEYFYGDPKAWTKYVINIVLPKGSAPGIWGLSSMNIEDKAWNTKKYDFTETVFFEVSEGKTLSIDAPKVSSYNVYPNPTTGHLFIDYNSENSEPQIHIYDTYGRNIPVQFTKSEGEIDIDMQSVAKGIYFVQVVGDTQTITKRIFLK